MKKVSLLGQQQILQVPIANAEQIRHDAVAGAALHVVLHDVGGDAVGRGLARCVLSEEILNRPICGQDFRQRDGIDELYESVVGAGGNHLVRGEFQV